MEGYELTARRGAAGLLEQQRGGALVLESDGHGQRYGDREEDIFQFLGSHGYRMNESLSDLLTTAGLCLVFEGISAAFG